MSGWIRTDYDFGVPWKQFTISARGLIAKMWHVELSGLQSNDPAIVVQSVERLILSIRPELVGLTVVGMSRSPIGNRWVFDVLHPRFQRVPQNAMPEPERLELCQVCKAPLPPIGASQWMGYSGEVCSEKCSKEKPSDGDNPFYQAS